MSQHAAVVVWERNRATFTDGSYSRGHRWVFDGGTEVAASASPQVVPPPHSVAAAVDPEEAFVAALASCHMLWFLSLAARRGYCVDAYRDEAEGLLGSMPDGKLGMTSVTLRPTVSFAGEKRPSPAEHETLHQQAHDECFLARSVRTLVRCAPSMAPPAPDAA